MAEGKCTTGQDDRLEAGRPPLLDEYYGNLWPIYRPGADTRRDWPVVMVPDPGDGSAAPLVRKLMDLLDSGALG